MRTKVSVGDSYTVAGRSLTVVEVKNQADGNGTVFFETQPVTAVLKQLPDRPLVVSAGDPYFACYLLRDASDPDLHAVGVYHPTLGERIQPASPKRPPFTEVLTLCWAPGPVRVLVDGVPADHKTAAILLERTTPDGTSRLLLPDKYKVLMWSDSWGALVDSGQRDGVYKTDADGWLSNAVLGEPIMFPKGQSAWGQRGGDLMCDGAEPPTEALAHAWLYFRGQRAELIEGQLTTLDWRTATIVVNGPADAWVRAKLDDSDDSPSSVTCYVTRQIPSGGQLTLSGLYPGRYCLHMWKPGSGTDLRDWSVICPKQWVEVAAGQTATTSMAFQTPPTGYKLAYVYTAGAQSQAGISIWGMTFSGYQVVATTDGAGRALIPTSPPPANLLVNDPRWGWQVLRGDGPTFEAVLAGRYLFALSLGFGGEGGWFAFATESHDHLDGMMPDWRVKVVQTGETFALEQTPIGARTVDPVPHLPPGTLTQWQFTPPAACYDIVVVDSEGTYVGTLQQAQYLARDGRDGGKTVTWIMGGKPWGDVLLHAPSQSAVPDLPEAARIGLEHGHLGPAATVRMIHAESGCGEGRLGLTCPHCLCLALVWPGPGCGYCPQCGADARSYVHGPPLSDGRWQTRYLVEGPGRARLDVPAAHWYRPLEYDETDAYLAMYEGLPRWVCRHPALGQWRAGAWTAGLDAAALEAVWCQAGERLLIRPKLQIVGQIVGHAGYRLRYTTDAGDETYLDFSLEAGDDGIKLLSGLAPVWAEVRDPAVPLFVRRVTSVELLEPEADPGNSFDVVGDVPSLVLQSLPIRRAKGTYLAVQVGPLAAVGGPDLRRTPDGRLFVAWVHEGDIYVAQRPSPQRPWGEAVQVTEGGHFADPSLAVAPTGLLALAYSDAGSGEQRLVVSRSDGETWEAV